MPSYYIAGPMRGIPNWNHPAFDEAAKTIQALEPEATVFNPASFDREQGFSPHRADVTDEELRAFMAKDLAALVQADKVLVLTDWEKSEGATIEVNVAHMLGIPVYDFYPWNESRRVYRNIPAKHPGEQRATDERTGGAKGRKPERYDLIPVGPLEEVARLYGKGAEKYEDNNWRRGYPWSWSYAAMQRHANAFWHGESHDQETGCHHMSSVVFHAMALMEFDDVGLGTDDRYGDEHG